MDSQVISKRLDYSQEWTDYSPLAARACGWDGFC